MFEQIKISGNSAAADTDGLGNDVTGATFTLTANDSGDSLAHLITVLNNTATDHSGKTVTIVGTDMADNVLTETITGPGTSATVTSTEYFKTVTSVTPSATIGADTFDIGWALGSVSKWERIDHRAGSVVNIGFGVQVVSGSPTYSVQHTFGIDDAYTHSSVSAETTSQEGVYTSPVKAVRLQWAAAGEVSACFLVAA